MLIVSHVFPVVQALPAGSIQADQPAPQLHQVSVLVQSFDSV